MKKICILLMLIFSHGLSNVCYAQDYLPDEPEVERRESISNQMVDSYAQALGTWKTAQDINKWVVGNFRYDRQRAIKLSSDQKNRKKRVSIYKPSAFFTSKSGVCIDLARFGVETLNKINPNSDPYYLMIEFDPIQLNGHTFRLHWLVGFKKDGKKYFFCDSKRPGHISGPYKNTQSFIHEYAQFRNRKIIAFRELDSYQKQKRTKAKKRQATIKP